MRTRTLLLALGFLLTQKLAYSRPVPVLSYDELLKQADVVLIVRPSKTRDAEPGDPIAVMPLDRANRYLTPTVTSFKVLATVKGVFKSKKLLLPHYRLDWEKAKKNGVAGISNGPSLVTFVDSENDEDYFDDVPSNRDYLLFLKRTADGSYDFVTGQFDPVFSVLGIKTGG